jgi:hypothetical protein
MPAPPRVTFRFGTQKVSAFFIGDTGEKEPYDIVCKTCSPQRTKLIHRYTFTRHYRDHDTLIYVYQCAVCHRQWAVSHSILAKVEKPT